MLTYYFRTTKDTEMSLLETPRKGVWIHSENPTKEEKEKLLDAGLDEGLLYDALDPYEVPRVEKEDNNVYFYTRFPYSTGGNIETIPILFVLTSTSVISLSSYSPPFLDSYKKSGTLITTQRNRLFLLLIYASTKSYAKHLTSIRKEIQKTKGHLTTIDNQNIVRLVTLEGALNDFISALIPTMSALQRLITKKEIPLHSDDEELVEDMELENKQLLESAKSNLYTIQNIRGAYTAIISNKLNDIIRLLTALTIILTIPTIIGALYGMNVALPFEKNPYAFFIIIFGTFLIMGLFVFFFNKKKWL
jgi:magnesium transporter